LFFHLRKYIFFYYFITNAVFIGGFWYALFVLKISNMTVLFAVLFALIIVSGLVISKLATETLEEYAANLQELSIETLHELNMPVATIKTNVALLRKGLEDEKSLKRLERIEIASKMVMESYNQIDYMIKKQTKQEIAEEFDLKELLEERVAFLRVLYPFVDFRVNLERYLLKIDKIGMQKVVDNIIDNGIKYSQKQYRIDIILKNGLLSIQDRGSGIDEVMLLSVFDKYYQKDDSMPGFGIGLAMVKRFCETNHIKLNIRSQKNSGTTLFLDFKGR
jgi:two-component system, OmpR family, sensor kinase